MPRLPILLALALVLAACGGTTAPQTSAEPTSSAAAPAAQATDAPEPTEAPPTTAPTDEPTEEPTPEPTEEPTPEPAEEGTSRSNPLPLGTGLRFETWAITVTSVMRGGEAAQLIQTTNQFNAPAPEGHEFLIADVQIENIGTKQEAQSATFAVDLRATGDRNILYSRVSAVTPKEFGGELFPGGTTEGQVTFAVPVDEKNLMLFVGELLSFDADARRFVAIDERATLTPAADLADIEPTEAGTARNAPAPLGETVVGEAWEVTVLEVKRGAEALAMATEANQFNKPPEAGMEYIAVRVRARYLGDDDPDKAEMISGGSLKVTGGNNKVYELVSVVPPEPAFDAFLFPGGETEGWDVLNVTEGEQNLVLVFEPLFSFSDDDTRFLALQ